ncbi:Acetylxylan esterase [Pontiella desulfatans]|uniref:Acetylxylan esterase n=1 Tax=Pontiella desulfatans TaxID=2750659 RepID=A0A6C2UAI2_PONDE|nr:GDSL-type esterase/lipase family protein [Pontiella desulfatans]VGO16521.1 Acetylxylan esterase [Pontiella desulfatans]
MKKTTLLALASLSVLTGAHAMPIKVACVGDSITYGARIENREENSYPKQLGNLLGEGYVVQNFGVSGSTLLKKGNRPYVQQKQYRDSLAFNPDIVIIKLGSNDSKPGNFDAHQDEFVPDAVALVKSYQALPSSPRVILCKPVMVTVKDKPITEKVVRQEVSPQIEKAAIQLGVELVDLHPLLRDRPEWLPDGIHPNAQGAKVLAEYLHRHLTTPRVKNVSMDYPKPQSTEYFHGYEVDNSHFEGIDCKIAKPRVPATGSPWIWRARFWGHEPQFDVAMLELGWHIIYCNVADLFGSPEAVERWNTCYRKTQQIGLNPKPVLEGMSRGGLIIHNWAVANPDKVAGIIADNAVLDFTSWPGGLGAGEGSAGNWKKCLAAYGLADDAAAKAYDRQPVHTVNQLAEAGIPLLYLVGLDDRVVPPEENSLKAAKALKGYPGLRIIEKPGMDHHPHALPNPSPIVDFALGTR